MQYEYPSSPIDSSLLWINDSCPDHNFLRHCFVMEQRLSISDARRLLEITASKLSQEPNLLNITSPLTIVGDLHGQFYDLVKLFDIAGAPTCNHKFLFLGDYVDRGSFSTETLFYLCSLKLAFPDSVYLLRGNHECRQMSSVFMFADEVAFKYQDSTLFEDFVSFFKTLPLACVVDKRFFCLHGGISKDIKYVTDINKLNRFVEIPEEGLLCDLLWADPREELTNEFQPNSSRGVSCFFNFNATCKFLERNSLLSIVRGHEAQSSGYKLHKLHKKTHFPVTITVFSCPNYVDSYGNKGAYLSINKGSVNFKQFSEASHPYFLPGFLDCFTWSLPFVAESMSSLLEGILNKQLAVDNVDDKTFTLEKKKILRAKLKAVSRIARMYAAMRKEKESSILVGNLGSTNLNTHQRQDLKKVLGSFEGVRAIDEQNEMFPRKNV
ncbi:hypothetical protein P9112_004174 [Eukaryota sp. TZLM1-RC]